MNKSISITSNLVIVQFLILFLVLFCAPFIGNQFITGTIVNATLIISFFLLGRSNALLLCFLPSIISLGLGFMPLAIIVPFIMIGNIFFVSAFSVIKNYWIALIAGGIIKASFLFVFANILVNNDIVSSMMSWPQVVTAMLGGVLAYFIIKKLEF
ncbi:MAG: hypothetical protein PHU17_00075 [Candidatus Pacebacteria bacterium]|nr:hypothetical protein [Candidatus Paceibacterota bacterium]MDD4073924.1 hypothetical protein [Candidatus Paceibacterota bacterium]